MPRAGARQSGRVIMPGPSVASPSMCGPLTCRCCSAHDAGPLNRADVLGCCREPSRAITSRRSVSKSAIDVSKERASRSDIRSVVTRDSMRNPRREKPPSRPLCHVTRRPDGNTRGPVRHLFPEVVRVLNGDTGVDEYVTSGGAVGFCRKNSRYWSETNTRVDGEVSRTNL
jgi:hypothetical protein